MRVRDRLEEMRAEPGPVSARLAAAVAALFREPLGWVSLLLLAFCGLLVVTAYARRTAPQAPETVFLRWKADISARGWGPWVSEADPPTRWLLCGSSDLIVDPDGNLHSADLSWRRPPTPLQRLRGWAGADLSAELNVAHVAYHADGSQALRDGAWTLRMRRDEVPASGLRPPR